MSDHSRVPETHPAPSNDPVARLRHTISIFTDFSGTGTEGDNRRMIDATSGIYPDQPWTGLTVGDLKALLVLIDGIQDTCRVQIHAWTNSEWTWEGVGSPGSHEVSVARADKLRAGGIKARVINAASEVVYVSPDQP